MNKDIELYLQMINTIKTTEPGRFYIKDICEGDNSPYFYRIFNYRLARYEDFCKPGALEMRGIVFKMERVSESGYPVTPFVDTRGIMGHKILGTVVSCVCRPMEKFFNYKENPFTMDIKEVDVSEYWTKEDGSLISSYQTLDGEWSLKSKTSFTSEQAFAANDLIWDKKYNDLREYISICTENNITVNMEYVAPTNRVVLYYDKPELRVLNARCNITGEYKQLWPKIMQRFGAKPLEYVEEFKPLSDTKSIRGIEGYIGITKSDQRFKLKTEWYLDLHRVKFELTNEYNLYMSVVNENTDDLIAMFHDDKEFMARFHKMEQFVSNKYSSIVRDVESMRKYLHLTRKEFAVYCKNLFKDDKEYRFNLAMEKCLGREPDYKLALKKNWKQCYKDEYTTK